MEERSEFIAIGDHDPLTFEEDSVADQSINQSQKSSRAELDTSGREAKRVKNVIYDFGFYFYLRMF